MGGFRRGGASPPCGSGTLVSKPALTVTDLRVKRRPPGEPIASSEHEKMPEAE
jgi:hypothetical protein